VTSKVDSRATGDVENSLTGEGDTTANGGGDNTVTGDGDKTVIRKGETIATGDGDNKVTVEGDNTTSEVESTATGDSDSEDDVELVLKVPVEKQDAENKLPEENEEKQEDYETDVVDHLHDIHNYAWQHLKLASDRIKTRYDKLANSAGYHEGDRVWLYRPTRKGK
jgi:hypothetical protein